MNNNATDKLKIISSKSLETKQHQQQHKKKIHFHKEMEKFHSFLISGI